MPWPELLPMNLRMQFVTDWQSGCWTMTELCADYQISRKTGYKWVARFEIAGPRGLHDQSRRPHHHPQAVDPAVMRLLLALRRRYGWGARKLLRVARRRQPRFVDWPSRSTVCAHLTAHDLVAVRRPTPARTPATGIAPMTTVNDVWTTDFKGEFRTRDGTYCYPFTLRDGWSRFVLRCDALLSPSYDGTRRCFERAFAEYGLPARIRSDNGSPFASTGLAGLSRLSVWWIRLGILPERIAAGHPEQNGSHEQFHKVLKAATTRPPAVHVTAQQRRFVRFCREYNQERPHEALHDEVPASVYQPSRRALPRRLPPLDYPAQFEIRRVSSGGNITWQSRAVFVSEALAGEEIAFEPVDDGVWTVHFATARLARFDERHGRLHPMTSPSARRCASSAGSAPDVQTKMR